MAARKNSKTHYKPQYVKNRKKSVDASVVAQRTIVVVLIVIVFSLVIFGVIHGFRWIEHRLFSENPRFEIQHLEISCDGKLREEQIREYTGLHEGMNLFSFTFDEIREELRKAPMVESVTLERKLPHTLYVSVKERVPVAQVLIGNYKMPRLMDRYGVILPPRVSPELASLPLIKGLEGESRPGDLVENRDVECVLDIIALCDSQKYLRTHIPLESLDIKYSDYIDIRLVGGTRVRMPRFQLEAKLFNLASVMELSKSQGKRVKEIDLTLESDKAPVRYY